MFNDIDPQQDLLAELIQDVEGDDWLAPLSDGFQATQLDDSCADLRRSQSSPSIARQVQGLENDLYQQQQQWGSSTPMAIRPMRRANADDYSSIESSQSFLDAHGNGGFGHASFDDALLAGNRGNNSTRGVPPIPPSGGSRSSGSSWMQSKPNSMPTRVRQETPFASTITIPAQGGHWAWVPEPTSDGTPSAPPPFQPPSNMNQVPVKSGRLPLPVASGNDDLDFLEMDILDNFDVMEMANTLVLENGTRPIRQRMHGSCPLPALLEDALSVEDNGSDSTMQTPLTSGSPSFEGMERQHSGSYGHDSYNKGTVRQRPVSIPIPARNTGMKVHRPSRSQSSPHLASNLLASSCPTHLDRPVRGAARRSVAVAAASLSDAATDEFDPDFTEGLSDVGQRSLKRTSSTGGGKKKHNPWSTEETMALINGVKTAGVGKWAEIKRLPIPGIFDVLETRSPVDLKDKWRNLTRIAKLPKASLKARLQRGQSDLPFETMLLVKALMEGGQSGE